MEGQASHSINMPYQNLQAIAEDDEDSPPNSHRDQAAPPDFQVPASDTITSHRWNHIDNLDEFFRKIYYYHQHNGFLCIVVKELLELLQFLFIITFSTFLIKCVNYPVLFSDRSYLFPIINTSLPQNRDSVQSVSVPGTAGPAISEKRTISDVIFPAGECLSQPSLILVTCWIVAALFWVLRIFRVGYHIVSYWEIRAFYQSALKISASDLPNLSWHEIQRRIRDTQSELHMCVHKKDLTDLDIYHRILRFRNYMVAMANKCVLPLKFQLPYVGEVVFFTQGLKYNFEFILFYGPWSPFHNGFHLKDDYKRASKRQAVAKYLSDKIFIIGIVNLVLSPLILLWQILYSFFHYAELIKREPGSLGARRWSMLSRLYLRHFNELEHELNARLNRAYKPSQTYMDIFTSPLLTILAKNAAFIFGSILAVLIVLTVIDEDVLTVEHVLTIMTVFGIIVTICRVLIPDENQVWCPEMLMTSILANIHYMPDHWKGQAHTHHVRREFAQLYQYKIVYLIEELLSPIITPFILCLSLRHKAQEIVDFLRHFTVQVSGVGDVCSFAQMDVKQHGNMQWYTSSKQSLDDGVVEEDVLEEGGDSGSEDDDGQSQPLHERAKPPVVKSAGENGKTELSLLHFSITNPTWKPSQPHNLKFLSTIKERAVRDMDQMQSTAVPLLKDNALMESLCATDMTFGGVGSLASVAGLSPRPGIYQKVHGAGMNKLEGPAIGEHQLDSQPQPEAGASEGQSMGGGILQSLHQSAIRSGGSISGMGPSGMLASVTPAPGGGMQVTDLNSIEMSFSTLYLHHLHHNRMRTLMSDAEVREMWQPRAAEAETTATTSLLSRAHSSSQSVRYGGTQPAPPPHPQV